MSTKTRTKFWIDMTILVCFVGVSITGLSLEGDHSVPDHSNHLRNVHSWLGIVVVVLGLVHFVLHWRWWINAFRRFSWLNQVARTNFVIACVLGVLFALITVTGFFLWRGENTHFLLIVHSMIALSILLTVITHIVRHWKWITTTARQKPVAQRAIQPSTRVTRKSGSRS